MHFRCSALLPDWEVSQEGLGRQGIIGASGPNTEIAAVVSEPTGTFDRLLAYLSGEPGAVDRLLQQSIPIRSNRSVVSSRLEIIWHRQQAAKISGKTSQLLAAGWSKGTNQAYQSARRKWNS